MFEDLLNDIIKDLKGFEEDVKSLTEKSKDDSYAQAFYAELCNIIWKNMMEVIVIPAHGDMLVV